MDFCMSPPTKKGDNLFRRHIGRIIYVNLAKEDDTILGVLLNHVTGATSFDDLTVVNIVILPTFC